MSSREGGAQSPPPETLRGNQKDAPSNAKGVNEVGDLKKINREFLAQLPSNPKGPLDDHAEWTARKR
ncbi:hypothetical protein B7463_g12069, partial [Scytalidium lignicola]